MKRNFTVLSVILALCFNSFAQSRLYVAADATGSGAGSSWSNAFNSLDSAFVNYQNGDTIWVKVGTYKPVGGTNADFQPPNGSIIYGGFAGTESSLEDRVQGSMSNLDGDIGTNGYANDNCRRVLYFTNNTSEIIMDGFRIRNGYAYTIGGSITVGGAGARISQGRVKFENCEFSDNYTYMRGGAMAIYGSSSRVKLINCTFKNNLANTSSSSAMGGAIFCNAGILTIQGCDFRSNTARRGGAISGFQPTINIDRSKFSGNEATANYGGAIDNGSESSLSVYNSLFVGNVANTSGAAIYTSTTLNTKFQKYINCTFAHNYNGASNGYAILTSDLTTVVNCIVWGNTGLKQMFNLPPAISPIVKNCILQDDTITNGSNMYYGDPLFANPGTASSTPFELGSFDYTVGSASEAVNNGDNSSLSSLYTSDVSGASRTNGAAVDIGAYESPFENFVLELTSNFSEVGTLSGAGSYLKDSTANIGVTIPDYCYTFLRWEEADTVLSTSEMLDVVMHQNRTIKAIWEQKTVSVTLLANPPGAGTLSGDSTYSCSTTVPREFSAVPSHCYVFKNWTIGGNIVGLNPTSSIGVFGDVEVVANFEYANYAVTATPNIVGAGVITGAGNYSCDSTATLVAKSDDCYEFINWIEDGVVLSVDTFYSFKVNSDRNIVANYEVKQYAINVVVNPVVGGEVSGDGQADCGTKVTLLATRKSNHIFTGWEEDGTVFSTNETYLFEASEDRNLKANFSYTGFVPNASSLGIDVYPNPARNEVTVKSENAQIELLQLIDLHGKVLYGSALKARSHSIDISQFASGVYYLKIYTNQQVVQQKLIVE